MIFVCIGIIVMVFVADFIIKDKVEKSNKLPRIAGKGCFRLQRYHNKGAMLNFGENHPQVIAVVSVVFSLFVLGMLILSFGKRGNNLLRVGLAFLLGGAFSNTYDRLKRKYVVDYLSFRVKWKSFADVVYNLSDFCIMGGALVSCIACAKE